LALLHVRNAAFPDAGLVVTDLQRMRVCIPTVEITDHRDCLRIRGPHRKIRAFAFDERAAELLVQP
jgi:hypothetical protein